MVDPSETVVQADPDVIAGLDYWRELPIKQQPVWPDAEAVAAASAEPPPIHRPSRRQATSELSSSAHASEPKRWSAR